MSSPISVWLGYSILNEIKFKAHFTYDRNIFYKLFVEARIKLKLVLGKYFIFQIVFSKLKYEHLRYFIF